MSILLVTRSDDHPGVVDVADALTAAGETVHRLDTDRFPTEVRLTLGFGDVHPVLELRDGEPVDLSAVTAVWYRRSHPARLLPRDLDPQLRSAAVGESRAVILGLLHALPAFHLDHWASVRHAEQKPLQLALAGEVGLRVPRTLVTNDPERVRAFAAGCPGGLVTKTLSSFAVYEQGEERVVFTTPIGAEDLEDLDGLALAPMTFQERIRPVREYRATVVGRRVFTGVLAQEGDEVDWRRRGNTRAPLWRAAGLPEPVEAALLRLADRLGLNYGAADLLEDERGDFWFLEINPAGEFQWLARHAGLPLAQAIADVLRGEAPRRPPVPCGRIVS